jgi:hypothetical protein
MSSSALNIEALRYSIIYQSTCSLIPKDWIPINTTLRTSDVTKLKLFENYGTENSVILNERCLQFDGFLV